MRIIRNAKTPPHTRIAALKQYTEAAGLSRTAVRDYRTVPTKELRKLIREVVIPVLRPFFQEHGTILRQPQKGEPKGFIAHREKLAREAEEQRKKEKQVVVEQLGWKAQK